MKVVMTVKDLIWRCIKITDGNVYYFNDDAILVACPIDDAFEKNVFGISKPSFCFSTEVEICSVGGITGKEAFEAAAAGAHLGCTAEDFITAMNKKHEI